MSVLASGAISRRARRSSGCAEHPDIESVVFGASSRANIVNTVEVAAAVWPQQEPVSGAVGG